MNEKKDVQGVADETSAAHSGSTLRSGPETPIANAPTHTPLPWRAVKYPDVKTWTLTGDELSVAKRMTKEDAEFADRACNSHYELLEALKECDGITQSPMHPPHDAIEELKAKLSGIQSVARAAITKAQ